ncbi:MAG: RecQ family ATP-dependent DNA helicase [Bacteroidales bacterium]|nr:RecQ family ATP-dependent DNA helicase [Bacteroidales bacterium]
MATPSEILKRYWGHDSFRPNQSEIIDSVMAGHDTLALMPTGGGKSLCYQIPALLLDGMTLVVSPLIALMKDQVQQLTNRHIKAACLTSELNSKEQDIVLNNCLYGDIKMLYVSPERLKQRVFIEHFRRMKISLIAVDEAHCVSQWGHDFRPAYLDIASIRQYHPTAPLLALTASATPTVVADIRRILLFSKDSNTFANSFYRPNLAYMSFLEPDKRGRLLRLLRNVPGCGIVYVRSRQRTCEIAMMLKANGVSAEYYHAGRSQKERDLCQRMWMEDKIRVIVATNAFGMGIDKKDVRFVVHLDPPDSPEAYFQEAGRAGRDGNKAYCVILYDTADIERLHSSHKEKYPPLKTIRNIYNGLCNYYKLPIGSGDGTEFPLDIDAICRTYNLRPLLLYNTLQHLEREGLIALPPEDSVTSRLHIPIDREEVYRFQLAHPQYDALMHCIFRTYGGLFSDFITIDERAIARQIYQNVEDIRKALMRLDALKIVEYKPSIAGASICFVAPRSDANGLYLNEQNYPQLCQQARQRMEYMVSYIQADSGCRSEILLHYFGETDTQPCQLCDLCITARRSQKPPQDIDLASQITALLQQRPHTAREIVETLLQQLHGAVTAEEIQQALRDLIDSRKAGINDHAQIYI